MLTRYIGVGIGSLVIATAIVIWLIRSFKRKSFRKLVKNVGQTAGDEISKDIKVWAKHTNNKFIPSSLFKSETNEIFQVDSIIVSDKAIIVIKIKSMRGGIVGEASAPQWEKVLGDKRLPIINPVIQNDQYIKNIVKMSNIKLPMVSLIVFSNRAEYIEVEDLPSHAIVIRHVDLFNTLDQMNSVLKNKLSENEVKDVYKRLYSYRTTKSSDTKSHKNDIQAKEVK